ncbi:GNAT family N-acetyltransferase [Clostridium diolis]|nr:GNAT family N-acetyltransferase [Clostridium diolis]
MASKQDCDLLFDWANDKAVRENSFSSHKILYEDHIKWFNDKINSNKCFVFILKFKGNSAGLVRIDVEDKKAIISYSIDKNYRGRGLSKVMLDLLETEVVNNKISINNLIGLVKFENVASQKVFESLKYNKIICNEFLEYEKYLE